MTTKIQNEDVKSLADVTGAGGTAANLIHDDKLYSVQYAEQLSTALATVLLSYSSKTANFTAANANVYYLNSTGGVFNVQLPSPAQGLYFYLIDVGGQMSVNNVTVLQHASESIGGVAASYLLNVNYNIWYFSSDGTNWYVSSGSGSGSGSSLGVNFITNSGAEVNTAGWSTYSNTAQNIPVNGTGGTATGLTFSRTTTSPLDGIGSFKMVQANSTSLQGKGVSTPFTIDSAYQAKPLAITFNFNASSTFIAANGITPPLNDGTTSFNAGNSDIEVFVYDVTNSILIPVSPQVITANGANNFSFVGKFQANSNSTSYRLIFHVATTSANATGWTFLFDQVYVGPQLVTVASPVTDWTSYTPTLTDVGSWTNQTTTGRYRRVGDSMEVEIYSAFTGTPTNSGVRFIWSLPSGFSVDATKIAAIGANSAVGTALGQHSSTYYQGEVSFNDSGFTQVWVWSNGGTSGWRATTPFTVANGDTMNLRFLVPIAGWGSTTVMSNDTDTRVVAFNSNSSLTTTGSTSVSTSTFTKAIFTSFSQDTHGAYSPSTGTYTIPVSGFYFITAEASFPPMAVGQRRIDIYQNGVSIEDVNNWDTDTSNPATPKASVLAFCKAGDTINVYYFTTTITGSPFTVSNDLFQVFRLSGPSAIAASESVSMRVGGATNSIANTVQQAIIFTTLSWDSHNMYNSSNGNYTIPISGKYAVHSYIDSSAPITGSLIGNDIHMYIEQNGSLRSNSLTKVETTSAVQYVTQSTAMINALAGDTIRIVLDNSLGATFICDNDVIHCYFELYRVGN